jgi:hypothetical protein
LAEVDLEFLGRQIGVLIEGQREIRSRLDGVDGRLAAIEDKLAETATRELMLRVLRSFEGQVEVAELRTQILRETLEARIKATEARLDTLEGSR